MLTLNHVWRAGLVLAIACAMLLTGAVSPVAPVSAAASIHLNRGAAAPGDGIKITGSGFRPGDVVVIGVYFKSASRAQPVSYGVTAGSDGSFTTAFTVPSGTVPAVYPVTARDLHGDVAVQNLAILPLAYLQVGGKAPTVFVLSGHGFYTKGGGFSAGETVKETASFSLFSGNTLLVQKSVMADNHGFLPEAFLQVPRDAKPGGQSLTAVGQSSGKKASAVIHVYFHPTTTLASNVVRPGNPVVINGAEFVPSSTVSVSLTIPRTNAASITLSRSAVTDSNGHFSTSIDMPSDVQTGTYTVTAIDQTGGFKATVTVTVTIHPSIVLDMPSAFPGQAVTVSGAGFGANVHITVWSIFNLQGGTHTTVTVGAISDSHEAFSVKLFVPAKAVPGWVNVNAKSNNGSTSKRLYVKALPPTPTPAPTQAPAPAPTSPPTPHKHKPGLHFRYVSVWYHTVLLGTSEHIQAQANLHRTLGIWVHVYFPSGLHRAWFQNTNHSGFWSKTFGVPKSAYSSRSDQVVVVFQLWHGRKTAKEVAYFHVV